MTVRWVACVKVKELVQMRVAVGGISHETNSFATAALGTTTLADFRCGR